MAAAFVALRMKGETAEELIGAARALREAARPFPSPAYLFADSCGTGGDGSGLDQRLDRGRVRRRGLRACRSPSTATAPSPRAAARPTCSKRLARGSTSTPLESREILDRTGFCFLFAPLYHPGIAHAGPVRRALKVRTIMNLLGPCLNPARPPRCSCSASPIPSCFGPIAQTLRALGVERALVVHGSGLDEVALHGETRAMRLPAASSRSSRSRPSRRGSSALPLRSGRRRRAGGECARGSTLCWPAAAARPTTTIVALNAGALADDRRQGREPARRRRCWRCDASRRGRAECASRALRRGEPWLNRRSSRRDRRRQARGAWRRASTASRSTRLRARARADAAQPRRRRSRKPGARFILEIKKASPSAGAIRAGADPAALARGYAGVADALSVLCDARSISAARSTISRRARASSTGRSSPRTSSSTRARSPKRGSPAPTRCWSCCRCSTMTQRAR